MKVGVLQFFSWPERRTALTTVYARALERIQIMDRTGYDAVWLAEHHFTTYSVCPSVHLMAMHVASRTERLRIGMAVSLAPFYHPLRLAEEVALLDVLSGGRVNWGAGRGFEPEEFRAFGVPVEESQERFRECVEIVLAAWKNERLDWSGRYWRFDGVEVLPKPLQQPHPPTWVAATSPGAIAWAAERGHSILMDPHSSVAEIAAKRALYRDGLAAHGHAFQGRELPVARLLAVADTEREAEEIARRGASWTISSYANPAHVVGGPGATRSAGGPSAMRSADPVRRYVDEVVLHGTPDSLVDRIAELRQTAGVDYLMCAPLSHGSFVLFTDKVLPRLPA
jgi:alkanesulfonate monooxygenase SsuD/methylene tetrahydromethanopterin reductase-like flavin-dependent oxidoreductase (luciferase family)